MGKEHDEHTAGLDVFSLEITPAEEALINKLKANANLINALLGIQSTSQHLIRKRITVSKTVHQGCCCVVGTNRQGTRENTASRSKSRKGQIWERRYVRQSVRSSAPYSKLWEHLPALQCQQIAGNSLLRYVLGTFLIIVPGIQGQPSASDL